MNGFITGKVYMINGQWLKIIQVYNEAQAISGTTSGYVNYDMIMAEDKTGDVSHHYPRDVSKRLPDSELEGWQ